MKSEEYTLEDDSQGEENEAHLKRRTGQRPDTLDMHGSNNRDEDEDEEEDEGDEEDQSDKADEQEESRHKVTHGFDLVEGKMDHSMEDFIVAEKRVHEGNELGLYAIFEGHSGHKVAEYLQHDLFDNILSELDFWTSPKRTINCLQKDGRRNFRGHSQLKRRFHGGHGYSDQ